MNLKKIMIFLVIMLSANNTFSQALYYYAHYNDFSDIEKTRLKRYYCGYGIPTMNIAVSTHYVSPGYTGYTPPVEAIDATADATARCQAGAYGAVAGTFFPFLRTSRTSAIVFEVQTSCFFYEYNLGPLSYGGGSAVFSDQSIVGLYSIPLGVAYKSGGEITLNKKDKALISFGAGVAPTVSIAKIIAVDLRYNTREYVMMEIGVFAGIAWKLRATYYSGHTLLVNQTADALTSVSTSKTYGPPGTMDVRATGTGDFNLSLVIMPFSFNWDKD